MNLSKDQIAKIRTLAKLGKDADIKQAVLDVISSANEKRKWQEEIEQWVQITNGYFHITTAYRELRAITSKEINAVRVAFHRLCEKGIVERDPKRDGWYRKRESSLVDIDWKNAEAEPLNLYLTLDLHEMVNLYGGDIMVIAGESNAGKSSMCLDIVEKNMNNFDCHYFSSELGGAKLKKRISFFDVPYEEWKMPAYSRDGNYHDVLFKENAINIIDFLIVTEDFWKVGTAIKEVHIALRQTNSIAIICLQKDPKKEFGRGGDVTRELASLYITLSPGQAKIVKLKDWKEDLNPNGKVCNFRLVNGAKWIQDSPWHYPEDDPHSGQKKKPWER